MPDNTNSLSLTYDSASETFVLPYYLAEENRVGAIDEQLVRALEVLSALTEFGPERGGRLIGIVEFQPAYDSGEQIPLLAPDGSLLFSKRISVNSPEDILGAEADHAEFVRWYTEYKPLAMANSLFGVLLMRILEPNYVDLSEALIVAEWHLLGGQLVLTQHSLYEG